MIQSWHSNSVHRFEEICSSVASALVRAREVSATHWQSTNVSDKPEMTPRELLNCTFDLMMPASIEAWMTEVRPNLPWAEDHFWERTGGQPLNPPPSEAWWPYAVANNAAHKVAAYEPKDGGRFSHTYPERFWPKWAGDKAQAAGKGWPGVYNFGIRYAYGDLEDVVKLLAKDPFTRQAFLPVWFPEDTGVVHGERVPCTLGYLSTMRESPTNNSVLNLTVTYYIRSCDFVRHFRDDVYMAGRLGHWVAEHVTHLWPMDVLMSNLLKKPENVELGETIKTLRIEPRRIEVTGLVMHVASLHAFRGDLPTLKSMAGVE